MCRCSRAERAVTLFPLLLELRRSSHAPSHAPSVRSTIHIFLPISARTSHILPLPQTPQFTLSTLHQSASQIFNFINFSCDTFQLSTLTNHSGIP